MDLRDSFFDAIYNLAIKDRDLIFITSDMGAFALEQFKKNIPKQFINAGISEQNIIGVSAGLALSGKKVFIYTITPFMIERCFEQIKVDLCCMNLPVILCSMGVGYTYSYDGPTHHTQYDISIMRSLPNLIIYSPSTPLLYKCVAEEAYKNNKPTYIRLDKGDYDDIYKKVEFEKGMLGPHFKGDVLIISTGTLIYTIRDVVSELSKKDINSSYVDLFRIKPLNESSLVFFLLRYNKIVVIEEHSYIGGIGSIVSEIMIDNNIYKPLKKISLPDEFCKRYGNREWIRKYYNLDKESIIKAIMDFV